MRIIDADALKEWIDEYVSVFKKSDNKDIKGYIEHQPTIEPKRGEWIGEADGYYNGELIYDTWYCSNCDYVVDDEEPPTWNFCPNCGADMREREGE